MLYLKVQPFKMSYTVEQSPEDWIHGSLYPIIYTVYDDTNYSEPKFKYVCDVYIGGSKVARLKALPNESNYGVFQINRIVDDFLSPTFEHQNLPSDVINMLGVEEATPYSKNLDTIRRIELRFGIEKAASATADPVVTADQITGEYLVVIKSHPNNGAHSLTQTTGDDFDNGGLSYLEQSGAVYPFLSVVPRQLKAGTIYASLVRFDQDIEPGQTHVVSFLNDLTSSGSLGAVSYIHVGGYTAAGGTIFESSIQNTATNGGEPPSTSNSDDERLLYFGSGFLNLQEQTLNSTISTGMGIGSLAYYEIVGASSATLNSSTARTGVYRFNVKQPCKYDTRRIMFMNEYGGWDFFNFTKSSVRKTSNKRNEYTATRGNWATATDNFGYGHWQGGRTVLNTDVSLIETLNTDWLTEDWRYFFESMMASRYVYLIEQTFTRRRTALPVIIRGEEHITKTSVNDQLIQYQIEVEYSNMMMLG